MKKKTSNETIPTVEAEMLILESGCGITTVENCPYCGEEHTHGRIYSPATKRFANCGGGSYFIKVVKIERMRKNAKADPEITT